LKELLKQIATKKEERQEKFVSLFIGSKEYEFTGDWQWDLQSDAIYCSDVMLPFPAAFEGTKGIIHPDDKVLVQDWLGTSSGAVPFLQFRITTTYGEVKLLTGKALQFCEVPPSFNPLEEPLKEEYGIPKQVQKLQWQARAAALAERITITGTWYLNTVTNEMYYSDGVYAIHELPPQSLNAHLHSFSSFIHPDDQKTITGVIAKSIQHTLPLHIEYRIVLTSGTEKKLRQTTHWEFTDKGALMLYGSIIDITHQTAAEQRGETWEHELSLKNRILQMNEQITGTGYWYINLLTRKIAYSDNVYRLHGLKPKSLLPGVNIFLNYIHPEDREIVKEITKKMICSHEPPDIEFRVVRNDGTIRYLRQRGKIVVYGEGEMVMIVSLQDITKDKVVERKSAELNELLLLKKFIQADVEAASGTGSWIWDVESGAITWSDGLYHLLGYKPTASTLTHKSFLRFIHTDDRKAVADSIELLLHEKKDTAFPFRIIRLGEERYIQASFKLVVNSARELFIATLHDVTTDYRMKEQLAKQVLLAESISQNIKDAVFITDENNNIILWNKACEAQFSVRQEDALHQNFFDVFPHLKEEQTLAQFGQALKGQPVVLQANRSVHALGYYNVVRMPLRSSEGAVSGILHLLHNVTKDQEMEQRLTERLNFIESLLEASVDHIIVLDRHMNYLYCNKKAAEHFGLNKEELIGKNVLEVFPASTATPSYEYFRKALQGETVHIPAIDGFLDEHYGQVYLIPIKEADEDVSAILWMRQDLSGEIKLQRQLKKSDEILKTIHAAFIELDEGFHLKYINPIGEFFFGQPKEALLGKIFWEVFPEKIGSRGYQSILKAVDERVKVEVEFFSIVFNRWVFMSAMPSAEGVIILFYDRQDIKETQQSLQEEHRRLQEAQQLGRIGSFEWNLSDQKVQWSDELYRINGMEPQSEVITVDRIDAFIHPDDLEGLQKIKEQSFIDPGPYRHIHRIVNPDGRIKFVRHQFESIANSEGRVIRVHGTLQDITDQERTDIILDTINEVCFELDHEFTITYANQKAFDSWKMHPEDVIGKNIWDAFPENRDTLIYDAVNDAYHAQKQILSEVWCPVIDQWIYLSVTPAPTGLILMHFDVTERRKRDEEIQKNLTLLQQSEDLAQIGSWEYDIASGDFTWSDGMYDLFSLSKGQKVTPRIYQAFAIEEDRNVAKKIVATIQTTYSPLNTVMRIKKGSEIRTLKVKSSVLNNEYGQPQKVVGVDLDITEGIEAETKIQESRHLLQQTTAATPDAITIFDLELNEPNYLNNCLAAWLGYTNGELMEMGFAGRLQLLHPDDRKEVQDFNEAMLSTEDGVTKSIEYRIKTREGFYLWICNRAKVFKRDDSGKPVQILSILQDITKEKKRGETLTDLNASLEQMNKELKAKNEEITNFAFIASHDLKEPIRKLHTFSNWLIEKEAGGLSIKGKEFVYKMDASVKRIDALIGDITVLTKLQAVKELQEKVALTTVLSEAEAELDSKIRETNAVIESGNLPVVTGNKKQLVHLFKNIISNGIKFQQPDVMPIVEIKAAVVEGLEGRPSGTYARISFTDNGIGFDQQHVAKIFMVFQRLHGQSQYAGTGIGLAICKKIMENHNGFITAASAPDKGAEFCCYFPL
jgi:PAS domain S-box-containing protein